MSDEAILGTGLPIPLAFSDPGDNNYGGNLSPGRACTRLRVWVANSGVVISLDDGVTDHVSLPANSCDDVGLEIPAEAAIKVKRYTADTAITGLIVEVR